MGWDGTGRDAWLLSALVVQCSAVRVLRKKQFQFPRKMSGARCRRRISSVNTFAGILFILLLCVLQCHTLGSYYYFFSTVQYSTYHKILFTLCLCDGLIFLSSLPKDLNQTRASSLGRCELTWKRLHEQELMRRCEEEKVAISLGLSTSACSALMIKRQCVN